MKTKNIFSLAALALTLAACSNDENTQGSSGLKGTAIPFTATISSGSSTTRGLTEASDGKSITAAWVKDEQVALVHGKTVDVLSVEKVDETSGTATISGTINNAVNGEDVMVVYLGQSNSAMTTFVGDINDALDADASLTTITETMVTKAMTKQLPNHDGTIDEISKNVDQRYGTGKLAVVGGTSSLASTVTVAEQNAIWKLTLTDGTNSIFATQVNIGFGGTDDDLHIISSAASGTDVYYVVMPPLASKTLTIEAVTGTSMSYTANPTVTLEAGKYYQSTIAMNFLKLDGEISFAEDAPSQTWSATATDNTYTQVVTHTGDAMVVYSISDIDNTCGASIDASTGEVTFTQPGSVTVTATVEDTDTYTYATKSVSYTLAVNKAAGSISYATESIDKLTTDAAFTYALTNTGDGTVTYESSNTAVAEVNHETGEVTIKGDGEATITATVEDTDNYTYETKTASYTLGVGTATMTVTADGYSGTYDGQPHGITVTAPTYASVRYGETEGTYDKTSSPTYINAGTYTVYYQVKKVGYTTVTGSATVVINKKAAAISFAKDPENKLTTDAAFTNTLTNTGDGSVTYESSAPTVASVNANGEVTIKGIAGTAKITATVTDGTNYTYATKTAQFTLTVSLPSTGGSQEGYDIENQANW